MFSSINITVNSHLNRVEIERVTRGTQREYSSKPLEHSIVKRILVLKR